MTTHRRAAIRIGTFGWHYPQRIQEWRKELQAVYVYFDNDQAAYAVENALALKRLVE